MHTSLLIVGRSLLAAVGLFLIGIAFFLYEDEEGNLENYLEKSWKKIREAHRKAISWESAFLQIVLRITSRGFDYLFGERLIGPKAIAASASYSVAAILVFSLGFTAFLIKPTDWHFVVAIGVPALFFFLCGFGGLLIRRPVTNWLWLGFVLLVSILWFNTLFHRALADGSDWSMTSVLAGFILTVAIVSDFLFIALTRVTLRWAAHRRSAVKICIFAVAIVVAAALLILIPAVLATRCEKGGLRTVFWYTSQSNLLDLFVAGAWLLVAMVMLLHRVIWPLIERPVYALHRYRIFTKHRKLAFLTGVTLLASSFPGIGNAMRALLAGFHL